MARGRGHRANLLEIGTELNLVPYLDMMTCIVMFLLVTMTGFLSFSILNASIPQLAPNSKSAVAEAAKKEQLLLIVRMTRNGFVVDPNVQGGKPMKQMTVSKKDKAFDFEGLNKIAVNLKARFKNESKVLLIADPKVIYDDVVHAMDSLREFEGEDEEKVAAALFPDVTLSIF